jgi:SAM-dependent methyltransferase
MNYTSLKKFTKRLLPESFLYAAEPALRNLFSITYAGNKVQCPVCNRHFNRFLLLENRSDSLCPACGALPRNRLLWLYLNKDVKIATRSLKVLHFSPSRSVLRKLRKLSNLKYTTTDFESNRADKRHDITNIQEPDNSYDLIICYHVLEHITDDAKAMQELFRILKPGGIALLQVPLKEGNTYEDALVTSREERLKHFGQDDHVRIYGAEDFPSRLKQAGFKVSANLYPKQFSEAEIEKFGLWKDETIFVCEK